MSRALEGIDSWNIKEKTGGIWHLPCLRTVSRYIIINYHLQDAYSEYILRFIPEYTNINSFQTGGIVGCYFTVVTAWIYINSSIVLLFTNATSKYNNDHNILHIHTLFQPHKSSMRGFSSWPVICTSTLMMQSMSQVPRAPTSPPLPEPYLAINMAV